MISASNFRFAGSTTAESPAFGEQPGPSGAMNCTVDPAAAEECGVRRIHDRIYMKRGDVPAGDFDFAVGILHDSSSF
jgi:hypothetical protein